MEEFKLYSVSDNYISYLQEKFPNVYSNKQDTRKHTRKYLGVVITVENYNYYIPMSSPKETDYQIAGDKKVIKKSIVPIIRIVVKNSKGVKELKGTLRISHMIPVPKSELEFYDLNNEKDEAYRSLIQNEIIFIRKNHEKIKKYAEILYKEKIDCDLTFGYINQALPFKEIEKFCDKYSEEKLKEI